MARAEDQSDEHGLQWRVAHAYENIEVLQQLRDRAIDRAFKATSAKTRSAGDRESSALWWAMVALRDELRDDIRDGVRDGLLPVLWCRLGEPSRRGVWS